jgi:hypothetical protein
MNKRDRRAFLHSSAGALAASLGPGAYAKLNLHVIPDDIATEAGTAQLAQPVASNEGRKPLRLGLIIRFGPANLPGIRGRFQAGAGGTPASGPRQARDRGLLLDLV